MNKGIKVTNSTRIYTGYNTLTSLELQLPNGKEVNRELLRNKDGVCALIFNTQLQKYHLVKQWRPCCDDELLELVAGSIEKGETPKQAIRKEVREEIGYSCDRIKKLSEFYVSPGAITEKVHLFYVEVSKQIEEPQGDGDEWIEIVDVHIKDIESTLANSKDAKTIIAQSFFR